MKLAGQIVKQENIQLNSFVFKSSKDKELYKLVYGVYPSYKTAQEALKSISSAFLPVIEKISIQQKLYYKYNSK